MHDDSGPTVRTERIALDSTDGVVLDAELRLPESFAGSVVLAHPHPQVGGSMDVPLLAHMVRTLPSVGIATLRFDFRGVGSSTGVFDRGIAERDDVRAAVACLAERAPGVPLVACGWSFGGDVSLCVDDEAIDGWMAIAAPFGQPAEDLVAGHDQRPVVMLVPEHDQFRRPDEVIEHTSSWTSTTVVTLGGTDHSITGRFTTVADEVCSLLAALA